VGASINYNTPEVRLGSGEGWDQIWGVSRVGGLGRVGGGGNHLFFRVELMQKKTVVVLKKSQGLGG